MSIPDRNAPLIKPTGGRVSSLWYTFLSSLSSGSVESDSAWGRIGGSLSDQTDLQSSLNAKAASSHTHAASDITSGTVPTARLGSGTANSTSVLRGDQTWAKPRVLLTVSCANFTPTDGQTLYFSTQFSSPLSTAAGRLTYFRRSWTIVAAEFGMYSGATAGSNEAISLYIRKNNTTDTLVATVGVSNSQRNFTNSSLSVSVASGDYFEMKLICPTWGTNPGTAQLGGYLVLEDA